MERAKLCPMMIYVAFLYIHIFRYGGNFPNKEEGTATFCCTDFNTLNV